MTLVKAILAEFGRFCCFVLAGSEASFSMNCQVDLFHFDAVQIAACAMLKSLFGLADDGFVVKPKYPLSLELLTAFWTIHIFTCLGGYQGVELICFMPDHAISANFLQSRLFHVSGQ